MEPIRSSSTTSRSNNTTVATPARRARIRHLAAALAALALAGSFGAIQPAPASAAVLVGQSRPAVVQCNYRTHIMSLVASASPAPGFSSQTVWYQYFVFDLTANRYVAGLNPTGYGTIAAWSSTTNAFGATVINQGTTDSAMSNYNVPAGHRFIVRVDYWWFIGGAWYGRTGTWTYGAQEYGWAWEAGNGTATNDACYA
jgi:hypothetical protein